METRISRLSVAKKRGGSVIKAMSTPRANVTTDPTIPVVVGRMGVAAAEVVVGVVACVVAAVSETSVDDSNAVAVLEVVLPVMGTVVSGGDVDVAGEVAVVVVADDVVGGGGPSSHVDTCENDPSAWQRGVAEPKT
mmetsp:Transcript_46819/g.101713  ORF Transcript_46819/g.101713 Transcript_46819/m.101713 type:complete len:136 (-) Transcript_46819:163-570(-)